MTDFFDCYCALGHLTVPTFGQEFPDADTLLAAMEHAGIAEALVYAPAAFEYDPPAGNDFLMQEVAPHPTLHPCWVLLPTAGGEFPPPQELVATMAAQGIHAARLAPGPARNNFSMQEWSVGPLLDALQAARIPLFIDLEEIGWADIAATLASFPNLPLVLTRVTYRIDRFLYPLWERHANLYVEISGYQGLHIIENTVKRFGPDRLLFGADMPRFAAGASVAAVTYAALADAARELIAAGNMRRLLEASHGH